MEFYESLNSLAAKIRQQAQNISTEEATKNAFVMPFIKNVLGYDVFDPTEVLPEFVCDVGTKKGEKIDYAIFKGGALQILIECKKIGEPLNVNHASQLFRYFHVTTAKISILTVGSRTIGCLKTSVRCCMAERYCKQFWQHGNPVPRSCHADQPS